MAAKIYVLKTIPCGDGTRQIVGKVNPSASYTTGGDPMNLSNYFTTQTTMVCMIEPVGGYTFDHNGGVGTGGFKVYQQIFNTSTVNGDAANSPLYQVHSAANLASLNASFVAWGSAK